MAFPPLGNNKLNALGIFVQRDFYDKNVFPKIAAIPIDMWYRKPLYGRVDKNNNSVYPSEAFLKQFKVEGKTIFAMNFVVDAFEDFKRQYEKYLFQGKLKTQNTELGELVPEEAWISVNTLYHDYISTLYSVFAETFINDKRNEKIVDFSSFIKIFIEWIDEVGPSYPFTRTGFIQSKFCSPNVSGLMIKMKTIKHDEDENKWENFFDDGNFTIYSKLARNYGFVVDKNAPWVLMADLASPAMKPYLALNEIDLDNLFQKFYYKAHEAEIELLKVYILQFYNSFVSASPSVKISKKGRGRNGIQSEIKLRKTYSIEQMNEQYLPSFWLKIIAYIRARETNKSLSQFQFEQIVKQAIETARFVDYFSAVDFLNKKFKNSLPLALKGKQTIKIQESQLMSRVKDFIF